MAPRGLPDPGLTPRGPHCSAGCETRRWPSSQHFLHFANTTQETGSQQLQSRCLGHRHRPGSVPTPGPWPRPLTAWLRKHPWWGLLRLFVFCFSEYKGAHPDVPRDIRLRVTLLGLGDSSHKRRPLSGQPAAWGRQVALTPGPSTHGPFQTFRKWAQSSDPRRHGHEPPRDVST